MFQRFDAVLLGRCTFAFILHGVQNRQSNFFESLASDQFAQIMFFERLAVDLNFEADAQIVFSFFVRRRLYFINLGPTFHKRQEVISSFLADGDWISFNDEAAIVI